MRTNKSQQEENNDRCFVEWRKSRPRKFRPGNFVHGNFVH